MYVRRPCSCTVARGLSVRKEKKGIAKKRYTAPMYGAHVRLKVFIVEKKRKEKDHKKIGVRRHFLQARPSRRHPIGKNMFCRLYFAATSGVCLIAAGFQKKLQSQCAHVPLADDSRPHAGDGCSRLARAWGCRVRRPPRRREVVCRAACHNRFSQKQICAR
jgi:hypothetical protein